MRKFLNLAVSMISFGITNAQVKDVARHLGVSSNRTTSLVFPSSIVSVDRGNERIMVQKSIPNVLKVKADSSFADTTSLTVITLDGRLYSFLVHFEIAPLQLTVDLGNADHVGEDTALVALARKAITLKSSLHGIRYSEGNVRLYAMAIYTTGELVICKLRIENTSSLSFEIGNVQIFSKDRQTGKRRSSQERPVVPLLSFKPQSIVRQKSSQVVVLILPKPVLSFSKSLRVEVSEKYGERNLRLSIPNRYLLNAAILEK
jgi:conjugative transposon TraN protein